MSLDQSPQMPFRSHSTWDNYDLDQSAHDQNIQSTFLKTNLDHFPQVQKAESLLDQDPQMQFRSLSTSEFE